MSESMKECEYSIQYPKEFIGGWYSEDTGTCDQLVNTFNSLPHLRATDQKFIDREYALLGTHNVPHAVMDSYFNNIILPSLFKYKEKFPACSEYTMPWKCEWPFNIQRFDIGNSYHDWHCENNGGARAKDRSYRRHLAFMTYLNDVTDEGETEFLHQGVKFKPEKGLTLIWPAHWTHTHKGRPSNTQVKYIATGWFGFYDEDVGF